MFKSFTRIAAVIAAVMLLAPAARASSAAARASTAPARFGVVDGRLIGATPAAMDAALNQDAALGVTAVREQLSWNATEPSPGVYKWAAFDQVASSVAAHHMQLLVLIDFTPAWARLPGCASWACAPAEPSQFAAFAGVAAARYGSEVAAWEVWNEPNTADFWKPVPNAAAYSQLLKLTAAAIRHAAPGAYIVSGGLAPSQGGRFTLRPVDFLSGMCESGGVAALDAVGDHPYSFPVPPDYQAGWNAWQQMDNTPISLRSVMTRCGASAKPIWITEYGAPTGGPGVAASPGNYMLLLHPTHVTEALQAQMAAAAIKDVDSYPWVGALFFYSATDAGTAPTTNQNFFGLSNASGSPKPAWYTVQSLLG
ncbi:MAG TPA: cellulase family glycosylhydrolase [Acidimicrobiales bacterium]|nr:cellulase family glycosylhydrolase [Acidimicrobiales bacterium]